MGVLRTAMAGMESCVAVIAVGVQRVTRLRPFKRDGEHTAPSNAAFDQSLRAENPEWGVRDVADLNTLARDAGLTAAEIAPMPANNLVLAFTRAVRQN